MKRVEASMSKFDFLAGFVLGALTVLGIMLIIMFGLNSEHDEKENSSPEVSEAVSETCEYHNAESTPKPSQAPTPSPTPMPEPTPELKETPYDTPEPEVTPSINVIDYNKEALISIANELSLEGADAVTYCAIAKELYLRGEWDGTPYKLGSHTVSIRSGHDGGNLLVDEKNILSNYEHLDLPGDLTFDDYYNSDLCVPGKGTFAVVNDRLVRCNRCSISEYGKKTSDWSGIDTSEYLPYRYDFYYDEGSNTLFLITVTMPKDTEKIIARVKMENDVLTPAERKLADGTGVFLYKIPNCELSKMQFVSQVNGYLTDGSFSYLDMNGTFWDYQEQNGKYEFVEIETTNFLAGLPAMSQNQQLMLYLNHTFPYSPFYGYYCCCGLECYGECKNCCDCKYCN